MSRAAHSREALADADLVARLRAGDEAAVFTILVNRARSRGARAARMVPRSPLEAPLTWSSISVTARCDTVPETAVLSAAQVCAALGVSAANQRALLHRARAVLRAALIGYHGS